MRRHTCHTCHLAGCDAACPPRHLFCGKHWSMVPADLQREVYDTVVSRAKTINKTWAPWWRAQASAEAAVLRKLHPDLGEAIDRKLAKEMAFAEKLEAIPP